jgi:hypothetical protein
MVRATLLRPLCQMTSDRDMQHALLNEPILPTPRRFTRNFSPVSKGHFTGDLIVGPGAGQAMGVESHLEMNVALVLSERPGVVELENQVAFRWWCDREKNGKVHHFDFRTNHRDGSRTAVMVKPSKKLACQIFLAQAREIAAQVTPAFADRVTIMTERDIDPIELHNAAFLNGLRDSDPEADSAARRMLAGLAGAIPVREIVAGVQRGGRGFRAVGRLLRNRELELVRHERITPDALVAPRVA